MDGKCKTHCVSLVSRSTCLKRLKEAKRGDMPDIINWREDKNLEGGVRGLI
jgi:hypothetical protein